MTVRLPPGTENVFLGAAFLNEGALMLVHKKHLPLDGVLHQILALCMLATAVGVFAELRDPPSFLVSAFRSFSLTMHGLWMILVTLPARPPSSVSSGSISLLHSMLSFTHCKLQFGHNLPCQVHVQNLNCPEPFFYTSTSADQCGWNFAAVSFCSFCLQTALGRIRLLKILIYDIQVCSAACEKLLHHGVDTGFIAKFSFLNMCSLEALLQQSMMRHTWSIQSSAQ